MVATSTPTTIQARTCIDRSPMTWQVSRAISPTIPINSPCKNMTLPNTGVAEAVGSDWNGFETAKLNKANNESQPMTKKIVRLGVSQGTDGSTAASASEDPCARSEVSMVSLLRHGAV